MQILVVVANIQTRTLKTEGVNKKMRLVTFLFVVSILFGYGATLPCLTTGSKKDFENTRNALKSIVVYLSKAVKTLDKDLIAIERDFKGRKWRKYKNHCYYFETVVVKWTTAERRCREIGGYLVKIDDSAEQSWLLNEGIKTQKNAYYWLGMTDVVNGDWRWIYDQSTPNYKLWYRGHPYPASHSYSKNYNCVVMINSSSGKWHEYPCSSTFSYICESNFCFS